MFQGSFDIIVYYINVFSDQKIKVFFQGIVHAGNINENFEYLIFSEVSFKIVDV